MANQKFKILAQYASVYLIEADLEVKEWLHEIYPKKEMWDFTSDFTSIIVQKELLTILLMKWS